MPVSLKSALRAIAAVLLTAGLATAQIEVHRHLRVEDGLVQSQVNAICEDRGGFAWFGTFGGVSRWDGRHFLNFQTQDGLASLDIRVIHELPDGTMLFGTGDGGVSVYRDGAFRTVDKDSGLPGNSVRAIVRDHDGSLLIATSKGLVVFASASFDTATASYFLMGHSVSRLQPRRDGGHYVGTNGSGLFVLESDSTRPIDPGGRLSGKIIRALHEDTEGTLWVSIYREGLWLLEHGELRRFDHQAVLGDHDVKAVTQARDGTIYLSTLGSGIGAYRNGTLKLIGPANGLADPISWCVHEGRSGVLYIGTWSGVNLYQPGGWLTYNESTGLPSDVVTAIEEVADGTIYVGTIGGGLAEVTDSVRRVYTTGDGLVHDRIWSLCAARDGTLYIGTHEGVSALRAGTIRTVFRERTDPHGRVYDIHEATDGTLYFCTYGGIYTYRDGTFGPLYDEPDQGYSSVYAVCERGDGTLYFGTASGILTYRNGQVEYPRLPAPLDGARVWSIHEGPGDTMYFGTNGAGLCMVHGPTGPGATLEVIDVSDGLSDNTVYRILEDQQERLYLTTHRGVNVVDLSHDPPLIRHLRHSDGLGSDECNQGAALTDSQGRLWFGNNGGVSRYDPAFDTADPNPPTVHFTRVRLFEEELPLDAFAPDRAFAYNQNYFRFEFVGTYPGAPEKVVYRYRLSGIDRDWVEAPERRVQYTALPHDTYAFEVAARNEWGVWSDPIALHFRIAPPFWKTWWFIAVMIVAAGGTVAMLIRNRVRHLLAIERLRTKIAADLHDDIGAGLTEISITSEVIAHKLPETARQAVSDELSRIGWASRHLVESMSDIVWLVNPKRDSLHDLVARLGDVYKESIAASGITLRVLQVESLRNVRLQMEHRQQIFLIFKEAINNSIKYSHGTELTLAVSHDDGRHRIRLTDDGRGFDRDAVAAGNGLANMEARARTIGARLQIESSPADGTQITLTL